MKSDYESPIQLLNSPERNRGVVLLQLEASLAAARLSIAQPLGVCGQHQNT